MNESFDLEKTIILRLPKIKYDTSYFETRVAALDGYIDVKGSRDSVTSDFCGKMVNIKISLDNILKIYFNNIEVAQHLIKRSDGTEYD